MKWIDKASRRAAWRKFSTIALAVGLAGMILFQAFSMFPALLEHASPGLLKWLVNAVTVCLLWGLVGVFVEQPKLRQRMLEWALRDRSQP